MESRSTFVLAGLDPAIQKKEWITRSSDVMINGMVPSIVGMLNNHTVATARSVTRRQLVPSEKASWPPPFISLM
jgi:hypothetical protein